MPGDDASFLIEEREKIRHKVNETHYSSGPSCKQHLIFMVIYLQLILQASYFVDCGCECCTGSSKTGNLFQILCASQCNIHSHNLQN